MILVTQPPNYRKRYYSLVSTALLLLSLLQNTFLLSSYNVHSFQSEKSIMPPCSKHPFQNAQAGPLAQQRQPCLYRLSRHNIRRHTISRLEDIPWSQAMAGHHVFTWSYDEVNLWSLRLQGTNNASCAYRCSSSSLQIKQSQQGAKRECARFDSNCSEAWYKLII